MRPFCKTLQNALICGVNDFDGRENIIPMCVSKRVLGQLPQPAFTSANKEPQCHCISINKDRSFYCVPNYRKIPSQPVKKCYSYLISGGTWARQPRKQASEQESLQAEQPSDQSNQPLPPYQWWNMRWTFRCVTSHGEQEVSACQKRILLNNECSYMLLL